MQDTMVGDQPEKYKQTDVGMKERTPDEYIEGDMGVKSIEVENAEINQIPSSTIL